MAAVLARLAERQIRYCMVTTSPSNYCEKVCAGWAIEPAYMVCYHDIPPSQQKPHPAPILKALDLLQVDATDALSFGDRDIDILASNAAGVRSVACLWGTANKQSLLAAKPISTIKHPSEILTLASLQLGLDEAPRDKMTRKGIKPYGHRKALIGRIA